ncbi:MAG: hypothetical protein AAEJ43_11495, partial [Gammaproteobacteria bacterium]
MESTVRASEAAVNAAERRLQSGRQELSEFLEPHGVIDLEQDLLGIRQDFDAQRRGLDDNRIKLASNQKQLEWWGNYLEELPKVIEEPSS